jgi:para-nitrobenzyl esterase
MLDDRLVFKGIPYARPPIGPLRFKPAVPPDPYRTVFNALSFAPAPMQPPFPVAVASTTLLGDATCSEDCLYLNVWTPIKAGPHPVFVWIYGGGNISGATSEPIYDGSNFARSGVVCVTVGYRVGAFGFLELGELLGTKFRVAATMQFEIKYWRYSGCGTTLARSAGTHRALLLGASELFAHC